MKKWKCQIMIINKTIAECEKILKYNIEYFPQERLNLHWTDYEDTNLIINLLKNRELILELGTYKGHTTENIANNLNCLKVITVDVIKGKNFINTKYQNHEILSEKESGVEIKNKKICKIQNTTDDFFIQNNDKFDGIFIDASHDYEQVKKDTKNSLNALKTNGIIIWHDVYNQKKCCSKCFAEPPNNGVIKALEEIDLKIYKIAHSWIAFYIQ